MAFLVAKPAQICQYYTQASVSSTWN